ncbi:MAG TPA: hypothetical protein PLE61_01995 [Vicinamibacterales bacterium]|nr:hypothetical protein [Vicinamibacterales bacterium]HPW19558.1 hypothetical protein [Vicinamibacterales bacterium]
MNPIDAWHGLLKPEELSAGAFEVLSARLRAERLTFGDRVHCPFLRPIFVTAEDERRVREFAETLAAVGERVVQAAMADASLVEAVGIREDERRLLAIEPGYAVSSTASRVDAFLLPESLQAAEYNAESPAGFGYAERLAAVFDALPVMARFRERYEARAYGLTAAMLDALLASYRDWGGRASPPTIAIVDWRDVPTWSEFEILQERFTALGAPTVICPPEELEFDGRQLRGAGRRIDLVYRRVLVNDVTARPAACEALVRACEARAVCMANSFRCKIPHKKAFFAVLTDPAFARLFTGAERAIIARHVPWTRAVAEGRTTKGGEEIDLLPWARRHREDLVLKPNDDYGGAGVTLGWELDDTRWDAAIQAALAAPAGSWVVQEKIAVRREVFPWFRDGRGAVLADMLVDMAPYLFRGKLAGFLTRLSATGLANVTSGGGQVPAYFVRPRPQAP